jgi:hypothetical protein
MKVGEDGALVVEKQTTVDVMRRLPEKLSWHVWLGIGVASCSARLPGRGSG